MFVKTVFDVLIVAALIVALYHEINSSGSNAIAVPSAALANGRVLPHATCSEWLNRRRGNANDTERAAKQVAGAPPGRRRSGSGATAETDRAAESLQNLRVFFQFVFGKNVHMHGGQRHAARQERNR